MTAGIFNERFFLKIGLKLYYFMDSNLAKGVRSLHTLQPASLKVMNDLLVKTDDSIIILLPMLLTELIMQF